MTLLNYKELKIDAHHWSGSALGSECTLHQLSPYIGKMKSSMASSLVESFSNEGDFIYDPFCGSGTIPLEGWRAGRNVYANDPNLYAYVLTHAKLYPDLSLEMVLDRIENMYDNIILEKSKVDLRKVPKWVRSFFHPETLRETIAWTNLFLSQNNYFLLSCMLGILHHQSPGFLSYPSSHSTPYLRDKKFPKSHFPELYEYRSIKERLEKKVVRVLKKVPNFNNSIKRVCYNNDTLKVRPKEKMDAIITSPPYMGQLDYGRDNRLRLWFLGIDDWRSIDRKYSPSEKDFIMLMRKCLNLWRGFLRPDGRCVIVIGDSYSRFNNSTLPELIKKIAIDDVGGYSIVEEYIDHIPYERRVRRRNNGNTNEIILAFRRN